MIDKLKDPDEDQDFTWDFGDVIEADETIASYSFPSTPTAITLHHPANGGRAITAYVGPGGTAGQKYQVPCRVVTNSTPPRTYERTIRFVMQSL